MTILLDNTVLTNFALIQRPELIRLTFNEAVAMTTLIQQEFEIGVQTGQLATCDWSWVSVMALNSSELPQFNFLLTELDAGEASCLAIAQARGYKIATDDKDARRWARQQGIPHTGTLGILARGVQKKVISLVEGNQLLQIMIASGYYAPIKNLDEIV
jgi:predicted nucleic acid-binding protein